MKGKTWGISRGISTIPYQAIANSNWGSQPAPNSQTCCFSKRWGRANRKSLNTKAPAQSCKPTRSNWEEQTLASSIRQPTSPEKNGGLKLGWCRVDERLIWALLSYSCTKWLIEGSDIVILEELYLYSHIHNHTVSRPARAMSSRKESRCIAHGPESSRALQFKKHQKFVVVIPDFWHTA